MLKIGIIGVGYWGTKVAREYRDLMKKGEIETIAIT